MLERGAGEEPYFYVSTLLEILGGGAVDRVPDTRLVVSTLLEILVYSRYATCTVRVRVDKFQPFLRF